VPSFSRENNRIESSPSLDPWPCITAVPVANGCTSRIALFKGFIPGIPTFSLGGLCTLGIGSE
jgi:hypothetical protein